MGGFSGDITNYLKRYANIDYIQLFETGFFGLIDLGIAPSQRHVLIILVLAFMSVPYGILI